MQKKSKKMRRGLDKLSRLRYIRISGKSRDRVFSRGCPGFDWYGSGCRLQVERSSPFWAKI